MSSCWVEVDLSALRHNYGAVVSLVGPGCSVINVVKANAYGLGAPQVAGALAEAGAKYFAVTRVDEALALRQAAVQQPILLLAPVAADEAEAAVEQNLTASVGTLGEAEILNSAAGRLGGKLRCHLKINSGMNRFGVPWGSALALARELSQLPYLELEGAFTHFANASVVNNAGVRTQFGRFNSLLPQLGPLTTRGLFHCANSAALVRFPEMRLAAVRPGTLLYGQYPSAVVTAAGKAAGVELRDPFVVKARVLTLQNVKQGDQVGYGSEWTARRDSTIAILACGYADGLTLEPRARPETAFGAIKTGLDTAARLLKMPHTGRMVTVRGQKAPLVGRIAMQTSTLDVTGLGVQIGDEVTIPMRRVTCGAHLPRIYIG